MALTQEGRPFRVNTALGPDALLLNSFSGREAISEPYSFTLHLLSEKPDVNLKNLLNTPMVVSMELPGEKQRHIHGLVNRAVLLEYGEDGLISYEAEIVPWFWFLTLFKDMRIFQNKTAPEIIQQVFSDRGFSAFELQLEGSFPKREYCVQYRETDFNFVSRLMEDEGIFYFFKHTEDKHTLVLANSKSAIVDTPELATAIFHAVVGDVGAEDTVHTLIHEQKVFIGKSSLSDYDFEKPNTSLRAEVPGGAKGEVYDYPGKYKTKADGERYAKIRLEEQEVQLSIIRGTSGCRAMQSGFKFKLEGHYREEENQPYTVLAVNHDGHNPSYRSDSEEGFAYENGFEAIPHSVIFRPPRVTEKPIVHGTQPAVVVGPKGEEIFTDKYGRVKVQFFWDREGKKDENSSCWIRVGQMTAGKGWGFVQIPRIHQEVIVDFFEGDPDQPIIVGRVYNADQTVPYNLPDNQTVFSFKSMSSKGGGGFNEIRFEDSKSKEQLFINAQKNMDTRVKEDQFENIEKNKHMVVEQNHFEHVKANRHIVIDGNELQKIGGDHHLQIKGKESIKIDGSRSLQISGDVAEKFGMSHAEDVGLNIYLKAGMNIVIEGGMSITLKAAGGSIVLDPVGVTIAGPMVTIDGGMTRINSGPGTPPIPGVPGVLIPPLDPTAAKDADKAVPGGQTKSPPDPGSIQSTSADEITPAPFKPPNRDTPETKDKTCIEVQLVDQEGEPVVGERVTILLPDGTEFTGATGADGKVHVDGVDPGDCKITFTQLDETVVEFKKEEKLVCQP